MLRKVADPIRVGGRHVSWVSIKKPQAVTCLFFLFAHFGGGWLEIRPCHACKRNVSDARHPPLCHQIKCNAVVGLPYDFP